MSGINAPDRFELFLIPEGMSKVSMQIDQKIPNAANFTILKEDHTLANLIRMQLLKNPKVLFAGYKVPHPLEHTVVLSCQTTHDTTPLDVMQAEINNLINEVSNIKHKFENEMTLHGLNSNAGGSGIMSSYMDDNF